MPARLRATPAALLAALALALAGPLGCGAGDEPQADTETTPSAEPETTEQAPAAGGY